MFKRKGCSIAENVTIEKYVPIYNATVKSIREEIGEYEKETLYVGEHLYAHLYDRNTWVLATSHHPRSLHQTQQLDTIAL